MLEYQNTIDNMKSSFYVGTEISSYSQSGTPPMDPYEPRFWWESSRLDRYYRLSDSPFFINL